MARKMACRRAASPTAKARRAASRAPRNGPLPVMGRTERASRDFLGDFRDEPLRPGKISAEIRPCAPCSESPREAQISSLFPPGRSPTKNEAAAPCARDVERAMLVLLDSPGDLSRALASRIRGRRSGAARTSFGEPTLATCHHRRPCPPPPPPRIVAVRPMLHISTRSGAKKDDPPWPPAVEAIRRRERAGPPPRSTAACRTGVHPFEPVTPAASSRVYSRGQWVRPWRDRRRGERGEAGPLTIKPPKIAGLKTTGWLSGTRTVSLTSNCARSPVKKFVRPAAPSCRYCPCSGSRLRRTRRWRRRRRRRPRDPGRARTRRTRSSPRPP